jgi:hypothetical protein
MADEPSDERPDADAVFQRTLGNLVNAPPKAHEQMKKGREPKPAPKVKGS